MMRTIITKIMTMIMLLLLMMIMIRASKRYWSEL